MSAMIDATLCSLRQRISDRSIELLRCDPQLAALWKQYLVVCGQAHVDVSINLWVELALCDTPASDDAFLRALNIAPAPPAGFCSRVAMLAHRAWLSLLGFSAFAVARWIR